MVINLVTQKIMLRLKQGYSLFSSLNVHFGRTFLNNDKNSVYRCFSLSTVNQLKKVEINTKGKVTTVEGVYIEDDLKTLNLENPRGFCPTCPNKLGFELDYTDVLLISQFVRPDGTLLPRRVTGLCRKAQHRMKILVHKAQVAGLMSDLRPNLGAKDSSPEKSQYKWKKFNVYFVGRGLPYKIS